MSFIKLFKHESINKVYKCRLFASGGNVLNQLKIITVSDVTAGNINIACCINYTD